MKFTSICVLLLLSSCIFAQTAKKAAPSKKKASVKAKVTPKAPASNGCPLAHPGPDVMSLTDEAAQKALMYKTITSWQGKELTRKDLSGAGGAKLFMYEPTDQSVRPVGAVLKIMPAGNEKGAPVVSLSDRIVNDAACALQLNNRTSVAKRAEGSNWFIQDSAGFQGKHWNMQYPPKLVGELMARMHKTPVSWATKWYKDVEKNYPQEVSKWDKRTNAYWLLRSQTPPSGIPIIREYEKAEKGIKWRSPISNKLVTMHGDFHGYNFLYSDHTNKKLTVIDLDTMWVGRPLADLARNPWTMNVSFKNKQIMFREYLRVMNGKKPSRKQVFDLMMDAELYKFFTPIEGLLSSVFPRCPDVLANPALLMPLWQNLLKEWNAAKSNKKRRQMTRDGIWNYMHRNATWKKWMGSTCGKTMPFLSQDFRKPRNFTVQTEIKGTDAKAAAKWLNNLDNIMNSPALKALGTSSNWDDMGKGGSKFVRHADASSPLFFGPLRKDGSRRFVQGTTRKSGYPYALFTGWMRFVVAKKGKLVAKLNIDKWYQMSLGAPTQTQVFKDHYLAPWLKTWTDLWNATNPKRRRLMIKN